MAENALALVVRGTDWSETSRIVTLFTLRFQPFHTARPVTGTECGHGIRCRRSDPAHGSTQ